MKEKKALYHQPSPDPNPTKPKNRKGTTAAR